jgi:hypothetical protein
VELIHVNNSENAPDTQGDQGIEANPEKDQRHPARHLLNLPPRPSLFSSTP